MVKQHLSTIVIAFLSVLVVASVVSGIYYFKQYQKTENLLKNPSAASQEEIKDVIAKVGRLILLPSENPTVATVADVEKLKNQPFFATAANGDKVLIFTEAKKVILYRPSDNVIIDVAPLVIGQEQSGSPAAQISGIPAPEAKSARVALRNGSGIVGITTKLVDEIKAKFVNVAIVEKENAKEKTYEKTFVVDVSGKQKEAVSQLADFFHATIGKLPDGEPKPDADILIIVGADRK